MRGQVLNNYFYIYYSTETALELPIKNLESVWNFVGFQTIQLQRKGIRDDHLFKPDSYLLTFTFYRLPLFSDRSVLF